MIGQYHLDVMRPVEGQAKPLQRLGERALYRTIGTAVDGYVEATGIEWVDWEDRR